MVRWVCSASLAITFIFSVSAQGGPDARKLRELRFKNMNVSMSLARLDAVRQLQDWPDEESGLGVTVTKVAGKTIQELLATNHIFPDVESFSVVYGLNPELGDLSQLDSIIQMRLPVVKSGPLLSRLLAANYVVLLTVDTGKNDQFLRDVANVRELAPRLKPEDISQSMNQADREAATERVKLINDRLSKFADRIRQRYGRPIPAEVVDHLRGDAEVVAQIVSDATAKKQKFGEGQKREIDAVWKDIQLKAGTFSEAAAGEVPPRWPEVKVAVRPVRASRVVPNLRVYYVPDALQGRPDEVRTFDRLSPSSSQSLPEADYCFWATQDSTTVRVTNIQCSEVRVHTTEGIDLTVTGRLNP